MPGPYDELIAELDHAAAIFGHRKVIAWCLEWAIAELGDADLAVAMPPYNGDPADGTAPSHHDWGRG